MPEEVLYDEEETDDYQTGYEKHNYDYPRGDCKWNETNTTHCDKYRADTPNE